MKLLFDQNLSHRLPQLLDAVFPGSAQVRQLDLGRADDRRIWDVAEAGGFAVVSLDADFAELAHLRGPPPKVVWLRCAQSADPMDRGPAQAPGCRDAGLRCRPRGGLPGGLLMPWTGAA